MFFTFISYMIRKERRWKEKTVNTLAENQFVIKIKSKNFYYRVPSFHKKEKGKEKKTPTVNISYVSSFGATWVMHYIFRCGIQL